MKTYNLLFCTLLLVGCGGRPASTAVSEPEPTESAVETQPAFIDHDSVFFSYIEPVEDYQVSGVLVEYLNDTDVAFVELNFRHRKTGKEFAVRGGSAQWKSFLDVDSIPMASVRLHYPRIDKQGIIEAPYKTPFFFADVDFDGQKELITGNRVHAGSQRDVGRFTTIYKITDGQPQDVTEMLEEKSDIFNNMDEYYFMVNPARKEILYYHDGGAINFGWEVHKYENGEYRYDRYVSCEAKHNGDHYGELYEVSIRTPQRDTLKTFTVDEATFDKERWNYYK